jgi:hypothetical protein
MIRFTLLMIGAALATAGPGDTIPYPSDYRKWTHVKSTVIGPEYPRFATNGGIHHFYANEKAMEGYRTGKFPEGAILIDDGLNITEKAGVTSEASRRRVAVMLRDSGRFAETGGWGFEMFPGDTQTGSLNVEARQACYECHKNAPRESVYSQYRK